MNNFFRILLIVLVLVYILNPYDILPDFLPFAGWLDDTALMALLLYYLRTGRSIWVLFRRTRPSFQQDEASDGGRENSKTSDAEESKSPHDILGVSKNAGPEEIRAAYRKAVQAYHPDHVAHLGPELRDLAQKKFVEIQKAYETLRGKAAS